jgi:hypothetical protein
MSTIEQEFHQRRLAAAIALATPTRQLSQRWPRRNRLPASTLARVGHFLAGLILGAVGALTLLALIAPAHADEYWQRIGTTPDGTIIELDLASIKPVKPGPLKGFTVTTEDGLDTFPTFFDCRGHILMPGTQLSHIPAGSVSETAERLVCAIGRQEYAK